MKDKKIVLLAGNGQSSAIVFNSVNKIFGIHTAIIEKKENQKVFLKRRVKRLGFSTVLGQVIFQLFVVKFLNIFSKKRCQEIMKTNSLNISKIPREKIRSVESVNTAKTIKLLRELKPDLIIVNGTRIISDDVLSSVSCRFINIHAGITPKYRGVHGAYWAMVNDDIRNCGVTVHLVDTGIDTGNIIFQSEVIPSKKDNFSTYPLLQLSEGVKLLNIAVQNILENKLVTNNEELTESYLWYHPTIWKYLYYRVIRGVK